MGFGRDGVGCADGTDATARSIGCDCDCNRGGDGDDAGERTDATARRIEWGSGGPVPTAGEAVPAGIVVVMAVTGIPEVAEVAEAEAAVEVVDAVAKTWPVTLSTPSSSIHSRPPPPLPLPLPPPLPLPLASESRFGRRPPPLLLRRATSSPGKTGIGSPCAIAAAICTCFWAFVFHLMPHALHTVAFSPSISAFLHNEVLDV